MQTTDVTLWLCDDRAVTEPRLLDSYAGWLSPEEQTRQARFRFARHRHQFLVSRGLLRWVLAEQIGCTPADLQFAFNEWGKPRVAMDGHESLAFNLSHTEGLMVLAVAANLGKGSLGVDVEHLARRVDASSLASRFFSPGEFRQLEGLDEVATRQRFFDFWTLKEAYIKAVGMGLGIPLTAFSFHLDGKDIGISFTGARAHDDPATWQFRRLLRTAAGNDPGHQLALAVQGAGSLQLSVMEGIPLAGFRQWVG